MGEIVDMVNSVLTMSDTSAIIKIILIFVTVGFGLYMAIKGKAIRRDQARDTENRDATRDQTNTVNQNRTDNQQTQSDSTRVDDFLQGGNDGRPKKGS
jgi:cytoskeletal protein RodZ